MCGIFGYIGFDDAFKKCIEGLKNLEYRGYDSSGIASVEKNTIVYFKHVGKVSELEKSLENHKDHHLMAISHTRWATHGIPCSRNAHPLLDEKQTVAAVHNGIIENYALIKEKLHKQHHVHFESDTDTEVIPQLVAFHYRGDFLKACLQTFTSLEGSFAIALIHKEHPDQIIAAAEQSPLVICFDKKTKDSYIASDANALSNLPLDFYFLENREIAFLQKNNPPIFFNKEGIEIKKKNFDLKISPTSLSKGIFEHFMLKEIYEQEAVSKKIIKNRWDEASNTPLFPEIPMSLDEIRSLKHLIIIGCGSSLHAGLSASYFFGEIAHLSTQVEIASEYRYKTPILLPNTLIIALSQSGETADVLASIRKVKSSGVKILSLCNTVGSTLARESDSTIFLDAGPEIAVASTKTFCAQLILLYLLSIFFAKSKNEISSDESKKLFQALNQIPDKIGYLLEKHREIQKISIDYAKHHDFYFLGRGILYPAALEAALKLKEIGYCNAVGYPGGEMKHGPIALLDSNIPVLVFCAHKALEGKIMSNLMESKARGAPIIVFGWESLKKDFSTECSRLFLIPETSDFLSSILITITCQLFAYYVAKEKGLDIDKPRNLAKSVTVE